MDLEKALQRKDIARKTCPECGGKGWKGVQGVSEAPCLGPEEGGTGCGGSGMIMKEVPHAFDVTRNKTPDQLRNEAFGDPIPPPPPRTSGGE
jgi:hypothetical protein